MEARNTRWVSARTDKWQKKEYLVKDQSQKDRLEITEGKQMETDGRA